MEALPSVNGWWFYGLTVHRRGNMWHHQLLYNRAGSVSNFLLTRSLTARPHTSSHVLTCPHTSSYVNMSGCYNEDVCTQFNSDWSSCTVAMVTCRVYLWLVTVQTTPWRVSQNSLLNFQGSLRKSLKMSQLTVNGAWSGSQSDVFVFCCHERRSGNDLKRPG